MNPLTLETEVIYELPKLKTGMPCLPTKNCTNDGKTHVNTRCMTVLRAFITAVLAHIV